MLKKKTNFYYETENIKVLYNFTVGPASTRKDSEEHISMSNMILKSSSTSLVDLVVNSSVRTNSKQTPLNMKGMSIITIVSIVLGGIGAVLLLVHLILTIKPICSQSKTI